MFNQFSFKGKISIFALIVMIFSFVLVQFLEAFRILEVSHRVSVFSFSCMMLCTIPLFFIVNDINANQKLQNLRKNVLEKIINQSALVSRADAGGKIVYANKLFCDISGYKAHEILGKDHSILNSGTHDKEFWKNMYSSTINHDIVWNEVVTNKKKTGDEYVVDSWITAEFDEKGNHIGFLSVRHDLTNLYNSLDEVRNKQIELSAVMSGIDQSSATIEFCTNGFIINANDRFLELSGYSSLHEISGKHHSIFMEQADIKKKEYDIFWGELRKGISKYGEFQKIRKDGSPFWINCTYNPIIDSTGKIVKILTIANDITNSVEQKIDLERKNAYLEHAAKILRHDMHSGINTYIPRGISSLERRMEKIIKECDIDKEKLDKILGSSMKLIKEGLTHSQKVYEGVKEFTNLVKQDSQLDKSLLNLSDILREYLKSTAYYGNVMISDLGEEYANKSLFCTAVDNLIRNGLKYNDSPSKLVKVYKGKNSIIIEDNGRGMNQSEFEEYSKPYTRKKGNTESGSGLGLNICIAILREHGWELVLLKSKKGTKLQILMNK